MRRWALRVADDDGRRVGGGVGFDDAVEPGLVERDLAAAHVAPGASVADVNPAVERAHGPGDAGDAGDAFHRPDYALPCAACALDRSPVYGRGRLARSSPLSLG